MDGMGWNVRLGVGWFGDRIDFGLFSRALVWRC